MPSPLHDDDLRVGDAALMCMEPGDLDRALVRFSTGIGEKRVVHSGESAKACPASAACSGTLTRLEV